MNIDKDIIEENAMSGELNITDKQEVEIQQIQTHQRNLKVKKNLIHHWIKLIQKF